MEEQSKLQEEPKEKSKASTRRWSILVIYVLYAAANSFQWMEYSIISSIVMRYYKVSSIAVDWTSIIYMLIYPIVVVPVSYFIEKKGLRFAALCGGIGTALAALIKVFSIKEDSFYIVLLGQGIGSTAQVFVLCLPSKIAAVWFKPSENSTACALAVFGTQLGFALGFIVPSTIVRNHEDLSLVGSDLQLLSWLLTGYMIPVVVAIVFFFPERPRVATSIVQQGDRREVPETFEGYVKFFVNLFKNNGFTLHTIAYGINIGAFSAIGTMLNQIILEYFPHCEEDAGRIGLLMVLEGMMGSVVFGLYLDKTHRYKETTVFIYYAAVVSMVASTFSLLTYSKPLVYVVFGVVGVFTNAYMPVGFELAVEITYPADESTTTGILNAMTQAVGVLTTLFMGELNARYGAFWALTSQTALLLVGAVITGFVPNQKRRQDALRRIKDRLNEMQSLNGEIR